MPTTPMVRKRILKKRIAILLVSNARKWTVQGVGGSTKISHDNLKAKIIMLRLMPKY
jgi:hypothetical protein